MIRQTLGAAYDRMIDAKMRYQIANCAKLGPGHIFDIQVDDLAIKLTFLDRPIGPAILERIQGRREPTTVTAIRALVRPGARVLELGGCYGYFTNIMAACAGPDGKVVSIEGTPNNYRILKRNIELNNLKNVDAYNLFITDKADHVTYGQKDHDPYQAIERLGNARTSDAQEEVAVQTVRLSEFLKKHAFDPDYVFMDIEGFEIEVFKDFDARYLAKHRPVFVFEIHEMFYKGEENLEWIKRILDKHEYYYRKDGSNLLCFPSSAP